MRRRARNALVDVGEMLIAPFARWKRERLDVTQVTIPIDGLDAAFDGYRIAFLSDLHTSPLVPAWWLENAIAAANALDADVTLLGGDFLDDNPRYVAGLAGLLRPLRARDGVFGVLGNHDHYVGAALAREALREGGVRELFNANVIVTRGDARLAIGGVGDLEMDVIDFDAALAGVPPAVPRIVLSHDPDVFAYWPPAHRLDLMLSGHTHGGQAYLPIIGPPYVPSQFGARYLKGLYRDGPRQLYVTRGIGASGFPWRWKCPPELTHITLRPR